ncbi:hypothetical protein AVEN_56477-1 [Araneus ventricosus]|uniref:Uncharacterized protein n=1 Tax=Araneus ventricosus TaxID=182803 RepID=A0A4Y2TBS5_ARAVE|nr:hypothetical protein AVEN_56477-1 [Araneus ventricosus]
MWMDDGLLGRLGQAVVQTADITAGALVPILLPPTGDGTAPAKTSPHPTVREACANVRKLLESSVFNYHQ